MADRCLILNYITKKKLDEIKESYENGEHLLIEEIEKNKTLITEEKDERKIEMKEKLTTDNNQDIFTKKDKGVKKTIYCNNQYVYNYFREHHEYPKDLVCIRCKAQVVHLWGIPIKKTKLKNKTIYHIIGVYHSNKCAYAEYRKYYSDDTLFNETDKLMKEINFKLLGTHEIGEAKNINLLDVNNGPLDIEKFDDDEIMIDDFGTIEFFPVRIMYGGM